MKPTSIFKAVTWPVRKLVKLVASATAALIAVLALFSIALAVSHVTGFAQITPVLTGSMRPAFAAGDLLIVTPTSPDAVRAGDVISFYRPLTTSDTTKTVIVHRVVRFEYGEQGERIMVTKGDANPTVDSWRTNVDEAEPGKVIAVIPFVGHFLLWATSGLGHSLFVGLSIFIIGGFTLWLLWKFAFKEDDPPHDDPPHDDPPQDDPPQDDPPQDDPPQDDPPQDDLRVGLARATTHMTILPPRP